MRTRTKGAVTGLLAALALAVVPAPGAEAAPLTAGAGRADITPPTGYVFYGWVRADSYATGTHTRLYARTLVLERDGRKLVLVATDLGAIPNGLVVHVAERVADLGIDERDLLVTATHTHSGPTGFFNYTAFNTVAPTDDRPTEFELGTPADRRLYTFLARQIEASIRRADADRGPARAGWGQGSLGRLTQNRSIEAHLNNHGIEREAGEGHWSEDPHGHEHTISPQLHVLRVDKRRGRRWTPIGMWSSFSNHGTVLKPTFLYYSGDHLGAASRLVERKIRRFGRVPPGQEVVNAFSNADEGDTSAGLILTGPVGAHMAGSVEAQAMMRAWRRAKGALTRTPALDGRWTRACFCGRDTAEGPVSDRAVVGLPFITGSEENRGPLYDETGVPFEGKRLAAPAPGPHGYKIPAIPDAFEAFPTAVPLTVLRIGDRAIASVPGEMTSGMGRRVRAALQDAGRAAGVRAVPIAGLANEFLHYFTTPEEYDRQHFEGGSTLYGRTAAVFIKERLVELMEAHAAGSPAPPPDPFDPKNGVTDDGAPFPAGAESGSVASNPEPIGRLAQARFGWRGGERGYDRPVDRPFIRIQRRVRANRAVHWRGVDNDLGFDIRWRVSEEDDGGHRYDAIWQSSRRDPPGVYRFLVTANRYRLASRPFRLFRRHDLRLEVLNRGVRAVVLRLRVPAPVDPRYDPIVPRPRIARGGRTVAWVGGRRRVVRARGARIVIGRGPGQRVFVARGAARDAFGNRNGRPFWVPAG